MIFLTLTIAAGKKLPLTGIVKKKHQTNILSLNNTLSYFIVSIVTFIALIIIIDTFKSPLNHIYPNTELLLYNLFESIKDIILFIKDLFV